MDYKLDYSQLPPMDKWILSKLNSLVKYVDNSLENYKITESARAMADFVDELSNWYVRRSRERFWGEGMPQDKINAYMTLYTVLKTMSLLSAPFTPFMAEKMCIRDRYTPMQLKYNNPDVNFGGVYVETTDIYKNVYDATNYNSSLDSSEGYTGDVDSTLETNNNVAYFAELVSVSAGHRYYAYPYTLYAGATQRAYDTNPMGTRIEISNK